MPTDPKYLKSGVWSSDAARLAGFPLVYRSQPGRTLIDHGDRGRTRRAGPHLLPALLLSVRRPAALGRRRSAHRVYVDGRLALNVVNLLVAVAAVATVGLSMLSFVIALLLAAPTLAFQWLALDTDDPRMFMWSWAFAAGLYLATLAYLLGYVFRRDVMTGDKLWGAAAAYLMIGVLWAYFYSLVEYFYPGSFAVGGAAAKSRHGGAHLLQLHRAHQHGIRRPDALFAAGSLAMRRRADLRRVVRAILIARLAGVYPPRQREAE